MVKKISTLSCFASAQLLVENPKPLAIFVRIIVKSVRTVQLLLRFRVLLRTLALSSDTSDTLAPLMRYSACRIHAQRLQCVTFVSTLYVLIYVLSVRGRQTGFGRCLFKAVNRQFSSCVLPRTPDQYHATFSDSSSGVGNLLHLVATANFRSHIAHAISNSSRLRTIVSYLPHIAKYSSRT